MNNTIFIKASAAQAVVFKLSYKTNIILLAILYRTVPFEIWIPDHNTERACSKFKNIVSQTS